MKQIIVNEEALNRVVNKLINEEYSDKVQLIQKFLDSNFIKGNLPKKNDNGIIINNPIVIQLDANKQPTKEALDDIGLFYLTQNEFSNILPQETRDDFIIDVIKHWYNNKISKYGSLMGK